MAGSTTTALRPDDVPAWGRELDQVVDRIAGDADAVVARCTGLLADGATHLSFGPPLGPDPLAAVQLLGSAVLPRLRG